MTIQSSYNLIFQLKHQQQVQQLIALAPSLAHSDLLLHQLMYALGQLPSHFYSQVRDFLIQNLTDETLFPVVRHQAAQALANYLHPEDLPIFQQFKESSIEEVRQTCLLAIQKIKAQELHQSYGMQYFQTKEPAAPFIPSQVQQQLNGRTIQSYLIDPKVSMFNRYRMMYYCRDLRNQASIKALSVILSKQNRPVTTALMRHQVCFIFGQTGQMTEHADPQIRQTIADPTESQIVRHQALNAFSAYSKDKSLLQQLLQSQSQIVKETAELALGQMDFWAT